MKEKKSVGRILREAFGFYKNPPYVEEKLREADMRSAVFLTSVVALIEVGMLLRYCYNWVLPGQVETLGEFFHYTYGWWYLLLACLGMLIYACLYLKGKLRFTSNLSRVLIFLFFMLGMYFGFTTSMKDFSKGRMVICFLTMIMYVTVICIWRPFISILLTVVCSSAFIYVLNHFTFDKQGNQVVMEEGDLINYVTFMVSLVILEVSVYFQRYGDATKSYKLELAAITDELTGLQNMRRFEETTREYTKTCAAEGKVPVYLVFDLRNFQTYNDRYNYSGGNDLLINLSELISTAFPGEPVARKSDDIFAVLTAQPDYRECSEEVRKKLRERYTTESYLDLKVGAYRSHEKLKEARHAVDRICYALKRIKNRDDVFFIEYDDGIRKEYRIRQYVLNNIDLAVREGYIKVYYQPVIWSEDGTLCGCEALARWDDPEMGFLSPGQFIPILEEARQIHKLDRCIYELVCRRMRECMDQGQPVLPVSMNFSRLDFELMDAVEELEECVKKYRIPKQYIHVEITESALSEDVEALHKSITQLHDRGYAIWLDDFGSGYSSMNALKDFDFDLLKIDMGFLQNFSGNEKARKVISSVLDLAKDLGMMTLTEGVETEDAVSFLKASGCGRLQGYFYGKPMPYEELLKRIDDGEFQLPKDGEIRL